MKRYNSDYANSVSNASSGCHTVNVQTSMWTLCIAQSLVNKRVRFLSKITVTDTLS